MRERHVDLVIGAGTFDLPKVLWRNGFGNKWVIMLAGLLPGHRLPDTQSGFQIGSPRLVNRELATVPGGRYGAKMGIRIQAVRSGFAAASTPTRTIFKEGRRRSAFDLVRNSFHIHRESILKTLLGGARDFLASLGVDSVQCALCKD